MHPHIALVGKGHDAHCRAHHYRKHALAPVRGEESVARDAEERQQLMRLKAIYRLEISEEERERQLATGLWKLAEMLQSMAKKGRE